MGGDQQKIQTFSLCVYVLPMLVSNWYPCIQTVQVLIVQNKDDFQKSFETWILETL